MAKAASWLVIVIMPACAQDKADRTLDLQQLIHLKQRETLPSAYLGHIVLQSGFSGGVEEETDACTSEATQTFPEFRGTVQEALKPVKAPDGSAYRWTEKDATILVRNAPERPSLLDATVTAFTFAPNEDPLRVADRLFNLPEVRKRAQALKLHERGPELGFASAPRKTLPSKPFISRHMTVRQVLMNVVAHHEGRLVWSYVEYACGGRKYSRFDWLAR